MTALPVTAVLLSAGKGQRFFPFITPKPLFPFMGQTLLERNLISLKNLGVAHVIVVISPNGQKLIPTLTFPPGLKVDIVTQTRARGMADAVTQAIPQLPPNHALLIRNGTDVLDDQKLVALKKLLSGSVPAIVARNQSEYFPGGYLKFDGQRLTGIVEKPPPHKRPSTLIKLVLDYLPQPHAFFKMLHQTVSDQDDVYERALTTYLKAYPPQIITYQGFWQSLKYPHHVLALTKRYLSTVSAPPLPSTPSPFLTGPIAVGANVTIHPHAVIKGPVYLGDNVVVGHHATVRDSIIEANATVGAYAEVVRSYLGPGSTLHRVYCGDSVVEGQTNIGAGTVIANWRFDQKPVTLSIGKQIIDTGLTKCGVMIGQHTQVGVNVSTMPGTLIGDHSLIGPAAAVTGTIPPRSKVWGTIQKF